MTEQIRNDNIKLMIKNRPIDSSFTHIMNGTIKSNILAL